MLAGFAAEGEEVELVAVGEVAVCAYGFKIVITDHAEAGGGWLRRGGCGRRRRTRRSCHLEQSKSLYIEDLVCWFAPGRGPLRKLLVSVSTRLEQAKLPEARGKSTEFAPKQIQARSPSACTALVPRDGHVLT